MSFMPSCPPSPRSATSFAGCKAGSAPLPLPILARSFAGLFFSYYITERLMPPKVRPLMGDDALDTFVDIYLYGILDSEGAPKRASRSNIMYSRLLSLIRKEFIQIMRDPRTLAMIFVMPVLMLFLLGYAATNDVRNIDLVVFDQDQSPASRRLLEAYKQADYFESRVRSAAKRRCGR